MRPPLLARPLGIDYHEEGGNFLAFTEELLEHQAK